MIWNAPCRRHPDKTTRSFSRSTAPLRSPSSGRVHASLPQIHICSDSDIVLPFLQLTNADADLHIDEGVEVRHTRWYAGLRHLSGQTQHIAPLLKHQRLEVRDVDTQLVTRHTRNHGEVEQLRVLRPLPLLSTCSTKQDMPCLLQELKA